MKGWVVPCCAVLTRPRVPRAAKLLAAWKVELAGMAGRIQGVRESLLAALKALDPNRDWSFVTSQIGMFSFTGEAARRAARVASHYPPIQACRPCRLRT